GARLLEGKRRPGIYGRRGPIPDPGRQAPCNAPGPGVDADGGEKPARRHGEREPCLPPRPRPHGGGSGRMKAPTWGPNENLTLTEAELNACRPVRGEGGRAIRAFCPFHGSDRQRSLRVDVESGRSNVSPAGRGDTWPRPGSAGGRSAYKAKKRPVAAAKRPGRE